MFVDASAIVAILTREPEADTFADVLENSGAAFTSAIAIFEAVLGICRQWHASVEEVEHDVGEFLEVARVRTAPITDKETYTALAAFSRYGNRTRTSRATQSGRLLCVCNGKERSDDTAVQRRRFRQDSHPRRSAVALKIRKQ
jgi:uncharacterized protein with PIN domain